MAKRCIQCQRHNVPDSYKFCSSCGTELTDEPKCKGCDYILSNFEKFCPKCGTKNPEYNGK